MKIITYTPPLVGRLRICIELAKALHLKGKTIIDIGCSNGLVYSLLKKEKPKKYIGIDPSTQAVNQASLLSGATFSVGTADHLPSRSSSMDIALMFDVIEHVPFNTESVVFKEVHRVLRKKGKFLLSTPHNNLFTNILDPAWYLGHRHYKKEQIKRLLEQSGFRVLDIEVRGGLWFSIYLIWLYFYKWILKNPYPRSQFLEKKDDLQFSREGIHTIFCVAEKL